VVVLKNFYKFPNLKLYKEKSIYLQLPQKKRRYFLLKTTTPFQKYTLSHKNKLFYFLITKKRKQDKLENIKENKISGALKKSTRSHYRNLSFVRINFNKFKRLFVLKKFLYNFSCFGLHKSFINDFTSKDNYNLLELSKYLCKSLQCFCGLEEVEVNISSSQLNFLPSFKFYQKAVYKDLVQFQKNRDLQKYFVEAVESFYLTFISFGYGNAYQIASLLTFLLENTRNQTFITKFLQKSLQVLFKIIPKEYLAIDGIKILIKGRFNKRRRTKKIVLQEGQISLQTISTPIDYYQTQAITIYGSFGIKVWISKSQTISFTSIF